jgi:hypothetical protein
MTFLAECARDQRFDAFDNCFSGVDVDTGGAVGEGFFFGRHEQAGQIAARRAEEAA